MSDPARDYLRLLIGYNIDRGMRQLALNDPKLADALQEADPGLRVKRHSIYRWRTGKIGPNKRALNALAGVLFDGDWTQLLSDRGGHLWSGTRMLLTPEEGEIGKLTITDLAERLADLERQLGETPSDGVAPNDGVASDDGVAV